MMNQPAMLITQPAEVPSLKEKLCSAYSRSFQEALSPTSTLSRCLRHSLENPGGMVRSQLAYKLSISFGIEEDAAVQAAIAVEYYQTASLLFDDLPCMDDASERRGEPTPHLLFGESQTILAALAFINRAYKMFWDFSSQGNIHAQRHSLGCVDECLGMRGLVGGQADDLHTSCQTGKDALKIAQKKTSPLLRLAMEIPASIGGANARTIQLIHRLSIFWGLAYQISDDFKDVLAMDKEIGKPVMQDAQLGRPNYVLLEGCVPAIQQLKHYVELARNILHQYPECHPSRAILQETQQWFEKVATGWSAKVVSL